MNSSKKELLVCFLCFNESDSIIATLQSAKNEMIKWNFQAKFKVLDNRSTDSTKAQVESFIRTNPEFPCSLTVNNENMGYSGNVFRAIEHFRSINADYLLIVDGDNQFPIEFAPKFYSVLENKVDLVLTRRVNHTAGINRKIGSYLFRMFCAVYVGSFGQDINGGMRGLSRKFANELEGMHKGRVANPALFYKAKRSHHEISWVPMKVQERVSGKSFINWNQPIKLMLESIQELSDIKNNRYTWKFNATV